MGSMGAAQIQSEMEKVEQAMVNIFGKKPQYVRPPYLETGGQFLSVMKQMNYAVITNDVDAGDWNNQSPEQSESKFQQAGASGNGHIPLMHETYQGTVTTLTNWLINWAKTNNLKIVTVGMYPFAELPRRPWLILSQPNVLTMPLVPTRPELLRGMGKQLAKKLHISNRDLVNLRRLCWECFVHSET